MLDATDKRIIALMQEDFPLVPEPYGELAARAGVSEEELLRRLQEYRRSGRIRKMGAVLRHREVGYRANALCAWKIAEDQLPAAGRAASAQADVTHCYARVPGSGWDFNFYVMLHARTRAECRRRAAELARLAGLGQGVMLFSTREWKKTSMKYFREEVERD